MPAPRIAVVSWSHSQLPVGVFQACRVRGFGLFIVESPGIFGGRNFRVGDLIICSDVRDPSLGAVLIPRGRGRVRLGQQSGSRLVGDSGEHCSLQRWMVAGGITAVVRPRAIGEHTKGRGAGLLQVPQGWVIDSWSEQQENSPVESKRPRFVEGQLSLFGGIRRAA